MSWRTNRFVIGLRNLGRAVGANRLMVSGIGESNNEAKFQNMLLASVWDGDCVWDVGANVGFYTTKLAEIVGVEGKIFAIEPSPINRDHLNKAVEKQSNVVIVPLALGSREAMVKLTQGNDPLGATSRVLDELTSDNSASVEIRLARADDLISSGALSIPNVIKIDTEGFELDVLRGMQGVLRTQQLRTLGIEVHFSLLGERSIKDGPREIEHLLTSAGFRCAWPDWSHLLATRPTP